jgi:hypothetical protein
VKAKANDRDEHSPGSPEPEAKPSRFTGPALRACLDVLRGLAVRAKAPDDAELGAPDTTINGPPTGGLKPPTEPTAECQPGAGAPAHPRQ